MLAIKAKPYSLTPVVATGKKRVKAQRDEIVATPVYDLPCDLSLCASWSVTHFDMLAVPLPLTRPYDQLGPEMEPMGRLRTIPRGRVTTYGALCKALGMGSPRSGAFHRSCVCHI